MAEWATWSGYSNAERIAIEFAERLLHALLPRLCGGKVRPRLGRRICCAGASEGIAAARRRRIRSA